MYKLLKRDGFISFASSLLAVIIGIVVGFLILLISNPSQALGGLQIILFGGFNAGLTSMGQVIHGAAPIILTGLSVGFAFKTGLFNIGASGQLIIGAFSAVFSSLYFTFLPDFLVLPVSMLMGVLAGGIWALVPGFLKAFCNVSEVISTIMMNYIGMFFVNYMVTQTMYDSLRNQSKTPPIAGQIPKLGLDKIFSGSSVNGGIFFSVVMVIIVYIVLYKTTFGYQITACGFNRNASQYAGINAKKNIISSMVIAGAIAGLAGSVIYLTGTGKHIEVLDILAPEGFMGIPVALLGMSNPLGILLSGLFISYLNVGGFYLQSLNYPPQIIDIIIGLVIYFTAFSFVFKKLLTLWVDKMDKKGKVGGEK